MDEPRKNSRIIKICQTDLHQFMIGRMSIEFPEDTEMVAVRDCFHQGTIDFVVRSKEFGEVKQGDQIPCFSPVIQRKISMGYGHAHSLSEMVKYFKGLISAGGFRETNLRSDQLTTEYCDELIEALNVK
jgi:hypothetical protein